MRRPITTTNAAGERTLTNGCYLGSVPAEADVEAKLSALCAACGACCDGTIFSEGRLMPGEGEGLEGRLDKRRVGLFLLPCPSHSQRTGCGVYGSRPSACRTYRCKLHRELGEGRAIAIDALGRVERIHQLSTTIAARLPAGAAGDLWSRLAASVGVTAAGIARVDPQLALDVAELALRLRRDLGVGEEDRGHEMPEDSRNR